MAIKSAINGEYILTIEDNGSARVCKIFDNVIGSLRECAKSIKFNVDPKWNTQDLGRKLIQAFGSGTMATIGEYTIIRSDSGHIDSYRVFGNTRGVLREIAADLNFSFPIYWNTRHLGSKLIDFINGNYTPEEVEAEPEGLKITPDMTTFQLYDAFSEMFGGHLRIKKGVTRCDKNNASAGINCPLSEIGLKEGGIYSGDLTVGEFTKQLQDKGLKIVVATNDDWVSVLDDFTLDFVGQIPNGATKASMQAILDR